MKKAQWKTQSNWKLLESTIGSFADQPSEINTCEKITKQCNWRVGLRCERPSSLFCFLALLFKGKIQEVAVDPATMRGVPARRAPPLHYLYEHAWRRGPATPKDSPSHKTCTGDPLKQEKITSERARIIQHFSP
jgi:hypothetical protein